MKASRRPQKLTHNIAKTKQYQEMKKTHLGSVPLGHSVPLGNIRDKVLQHPLARSSHHPALRRMGQSQKDSLLKWKSTLLSSSHTVLRALSSCDIEGLHQVTHLFCQSSSWWWYLALTIFSKQDHIPVPWRGSSPVIYSHCKVWTESQAIKLSRQLLKDQHPMFPLGRLERFHDRSHFPMTEETACIQSINKIWGIMS